MRRYDPYQDQDYQHLQEGPSRDHFFGTDNLGRDNWSRVLTGVEISLQIGLGTQVMVLFVGVVVGVGAAMGGRTSDNILMRLTDITYAFPDLLFIILMRSVLVGRDWPLLGDPRLQIMLAIAMVNWTTIARLIRGQMLSLAERDYVQAARALGASNLRIVTRHMLPNTLGPVIVAFTFGIPIAIFAEAALGFIGFGLPPPTASLGRLVSDGYTYIQVNIWVVSLPRRRHRPADALLHLLGRRAAGRAGPAYALEGTEQSRAAIRLALSFLCFRTWPAARPRPPPRRPCRPRTAGTAPPATPGSRGAAPASG